MFEKIRKRLKKLVKRESKNKKDLEALRENFEKRLNKFQAKNNKELEEEIFIIEKTIKKIDKKLKNL